MWLTTQTVFLRDAADLPACEAAFAASPFSASCLDHFVIQPPCAGARVAIEAWAIGGPAVSVKKLSPQAVSVRYDGLRWLHTRATRSLPADATVYPAACELFQRTDGLLAAAGLNLEHIVRTWWYLGGITAGEGVTQRYLELNRARADVFAGLHFGAGHMPLRRGQAGFPASTGIGMADTAGLGLTTLALQTDRPDVRLLPLENPLQTPAYDYAACYSPKSPKFSRAMALVMPDYLTTWISGTASIVNSEVLYPGCVVGQTEQTLDNLAALLAPENVACHGVTRAGATLADLAKVRVYVKRAADFAACRAVCQRRLGDVPAVYVVADVCRPDLLVEIEGVAFSRRPPTAKT